MLSFRILFFLLVEMCCLPARLERLTSPHRARHASVQLIEQQRPWTSCLHICAVVPALCSTDRGRRAINERHSVPLSIFVNGNVAEIKECVLRPPNEAQQAEMNESLINRGPHLHTYRLLLVTFGSDSVSLDAAGTDHISGVFWHLGHIWSICAVTAGSHLACTALASAVPEKYTSSCYLGRCLLAGF